MVIHDCSLCLFTKPTPTVACVSLLNQLQPRALKGPCREPQRRYQSELRSTRRVERFVFEVCDKKIVWNCGKIRKIVSRFSKYGKKLRKTIVGKIFPSKSCLSRLPEYKTRSLDESIRGTVWPESCTMNKRKRSRLKVTIESLFSKTCKEVRPPLETSVCTK